MSDVPPIPPVPPRDPRGLVGWGLLLAGAVILLLVRLLGGGCGT